MFEALSFLQLQEYWWLLVSILGASLVFLLFVQGGQSLIYSIGKEEPQISMLVNSMGKKWELTFTTLVTFGGAFFASFPLFYSTSFGGAYWLWMVVLITFILQAVSYEFRIKQSNIFGKKTFEWFLFLNGLIGTVSLGVVVATLFTGGNFTHNDMNFTSWSNKLHGLEAFANPINLLLGFSVFFLSRIIAILYFNHTIADDKIAERSKKQLKINSIAFVLLFVPFLIAIWLSNGYGYDPNTGIIYTEKYKYFFNNIEFPITGILLALGVILVLYGLFVSNLCAKTKKTKSLYAVGIGTFLTTLSLFFNVGYNNTVFYPSLQNLQDGLTIENASSSKFTLTVMSYISLLIPFVVAYIIFVWKTLNKKKINADEINDNSHKY
ncbi:MAG: cytochrome d ubiquinol oxidase subunit II [Bacteroidales bacterium]|nr:cytochrome d ubiquinol oxidase subunit II [Bacteroidales bacterium]